MCSLGSFSSFLLVYCVYTMSRLYFNPQNTLSTLVYVPYTGVYCVYAISLSAPDPHAPLLSTAVYCVYTMSRALFFATKNLYTPLYRVGACICSDKSKKKPSLLPQ